MPLCMIQSILQNPSNLSGRPRAVLRRLETTALARGEEYFQFDAFSAQVLNDRSISQTS